MWCAACRAHPQRAAQPARIAGITNMKWFKSAKHQKCGTHAVSLALWSSGGRVSHDTGGYEIRSGVPMKLNGGAKNLIGAGYGIDTGVYGIDIGCL